MAHTNCGRMRVDWGDLPEDIILKILCAGGRSVGRVMMAVNRRFCHAILRAAKGLTICDNIPHRYLGWLGGLEWLEMVDQNPACLDIILMFCPDLTRLCLKFPLLRTWNMGTDSSSCLLEALTYAAYWKKLLILEVETPPGTRGTSITSIVEIQTLREFSWVAQEVKDFDFHVFARIPQLTRLQLKFEDGRGFLNLLGLGELTQLKQLTFWVDCHDFHYSEPANFEKLTNLSQLSFSFGGSDLPCFSGLMGLRDLRLSFYEALSEFGFSSIEFLTNLESLSISTEDEDLHQNLGVLSTLSRLKFLEVKGEDQYFDEVDIAPIRELTHLTSLVFKCKIKSIAQLSALRNVRDLAIGITSDAIMKELDAYFSDLKSLDIVNHAITPVGWSFLEKLQGLTSLRVKSFKRTGKVVGLEGICAIARLRGLKSLNICFDNCGDEHVHNFFTCSHLTTLTFEKCGVTEVGLKFLRERLPGCDVKIL